MSEAAKMSEATVETLDSFLVETGAVKRGHFKLSSGLHSDTYVQCALLLRHPRHSAVVGRALAERFSDTPIDTVVAPAMGGLIIGYAVADALGVPFLFTERVDGGMALRRGFSLDAGERVLIVEDVVTTGGSAAETAELITSLGAQVVGVGSVIKRAADDERTAGWRHLVRVDAVAWEPGSCPLCAEGQPIDYPGSRR